MRGNVVRYLLEHVATGQYSETTYTNWGDWGPAKPNLGIDFINLPYITHGEFKLTETKAVCQYIVHKFKPELLGTTPQEKARAYQLQTIANEQFFTFIKLCFGQD